MQVRKLPACFSSLLVPGSQRSTLRTGIYSCGFGFVDTSEGLLLPEGWLIYRLDSRAPDQLALEPTQNATIQL